MSDWQLSSNTVEFRNEERRAANRGDQLFTTPAPVKLTGRQQLALDYITTHQPVTSEQLGAILHEDRRERGGRGHHRDERCAYCHDEGSQMGRALRAKRLVVRKRGLGWCLPDYKPVPHVDSGYDPSTAPIPF